MKGLLKFLFDHPKLFAFLCGAILNLAIAPLFFIPAVFVLGILLKIIVSCKKYKQALWCGWLFGLGYFIVGLYWITIGVSVYADQFWWFMPVAFVGLPSFLALYFCLMAGAIWYFRTNMFVIFIASAAWTGSEILRAFLFTGFPWNSLGYVFAEQLEIMQVASIVGVYGLSLLAAYLGFVFHCFFEKKYQNFASHVIFAAAVVGGVYHYGDTRIQSYADSYTNVYAKLVQPSISQTSKWSPSEFWTNIQKHAALSKDTHIVGERMPDLVIWPESAVTYPPTTQEVRSALQLVVENSDTVLILGGLTLLKEATADQYNVYVSMYSFDARENMAFDYHKSHLIPFGEYVPFKKYLPFMKKITHGMIDYTPGNGSEIVQISNKSMNLRIRPLICYEAIFPEESRTDNTKADVIINVTNDAWYGDSSGPYQHFAMVKLRAVENGIPLIRVANNGITGVINPLGKVLVSTNLNDIASVNTFVPTKLSEPTFFALNGSIIVYGTIVGLVLLSIIFHRVITIASGGKLEEPKKEEDDGGGTYH